MNKEEHLVYFVGAGPGDPELITMKGARLLREADLVVYAGSLVNPSVLDHCMEGCEKEDSAALSLEEQVEIMSQAALAGHRVVRLHTGDPSLYGAVAEQKKRLEDMGIRVRFVPGVSSLQAAAASLGIEYTVPGGTQTLICTRRKGRTPVPAEEDLSVLAGSGSTMVIFLSSDQAEKVAEDLIKGGISPSTPSACVYRASWKDEKVLRSPLEKLPALMEREDIRRHALIIVGECIDPEETRSLLYDPHFSHGYRRSEE